jgi:hypothetical protein
MTTLEAERPLEANILPFPLADRVPTAPALAPQEPWWPIPSTVAATAPDEPTLCDTTEPGLVPSHVVGVSVALVQASMLWLAFQPV